MYFIAFILPSLFLLVKSWICTKNVFFLQDCRLFFELVGVHSKTNIAPGRRHFQKETHLNQPQCFRCNVSFREGTMLFFTAIVFVDPFSRPWPKMFSFTICLYKATCKNLLREMSCVCVGS